MDGEGGTGATLWEGASRWCPGWREVKELQEEADMRVSVRQRGPPLTWESAVNSADAIAWSLGLPS